MSTSKTILIMAGGTGGHIFPGLAVAEVLRAQGHTVVWLGAEGAMEERIVPQHGIELHTLKIKGLRGNGLLGWLKAPFNVIKAIAMARSMIKSIQPDAVLGMGGYASGPGALAAWLLRIPVVIHEQNAIAGLTNRTLHNFSTRTCEGFEGTFRNTYRLFSTGNPVRQEIQPTSKEPSERLRVLVIGGSLGAQVLNERVPQAMQLLDENQFEVWHQSGRNKLNQTEQAYANLKHPKRIAEFIDDMPTAYQWADVVICRAGALTVAELAQSGNVGIFVPLPIAVDDHQTANANYLVSRDAGVMIPQNKLTAEALAEQLLQWQQQPSVLQTMRENALAAARPKAAEAVAQLCLQVIE